jgi:hypothetical protein
MTLLAKQIKYHMSIGEDAEQILARGYGSSVHEVGFIMEQIKIAQGN